MITRIEIDGFKSFRSFAVSLRPFQIIVGPNGAGKSNLFDAIQLLSYLADTYTVQQAFDKLRGQVGELFTIEPDGNRYRIMRFAVEMLIDHAVTDDLGVMNNVTTNRLRYELAIERREDVDQTEQLCVIHEVLRPLGAKDDRWARLNISSKAREFWVVRSKGRRVPFISTEISSDGYTILNKHQDGQSRHLGAQVDEPVERTILSTITSVDYPTALAVRQAMLSWRFLHLSPYALRHASRVDATGELAHDGSNLPTVLYRMSTEDDTALRNVSKEMAKIVPGLLQIGVKATADHSKFNIEGQTDDGAIFPANVLSDGILRLLAIVALSEDSSHHGVICIEEPESSVPPPRMHEFVKVLRSLATDFEDANASLLYTRQLLVATHSSKIIAYTRPEDLLYAYLSQERPRTARMTPVAASASPDVTSKEEQAFTLEQVRQFLDPDAEAEAQQTLNELTES